MSTSLTSRTCRVVAGASRCGVCTERRHAPWSLCPRHGRGSAGGFIGSCTRNGARNLQIGPRPGTFRVDLCLDAVLERLVPGVRIGGKIQPVGRDIAVIVPDTVTHAPL
jgi:hypothetical protein